MCVRVGGCDTGGTKQEEAAVERCWPAAIDYIRLPCGGWQRARVLLLSAQFDVQVGVERTLPYAWWLSLRSGVGVSDYPGFRDAKGESEMRTSGIPPKPELSTTIRMNRTADQVSTYCQTNNHLPVYLLICLYSSESPIIIDTQVCAHFICESRA